MNLIWKCCALTLGLAVWGLGQAQAGSEAVSARTGAQKQFDPALEELAPADQLGSLYVLACLSAMARGEIATAEVACGKAIALDAGDADAYKLRGYAYLLEHRFERAEVDFRAALKLQPNDPEDVAGLAQSLTGQGRFGAAVKQFGKAVTLAPSNAAYRNGLCWARAGTGKNLPEALADCNRALVLAPDAPGILNSRGLVYLRMRQYETAIQDYSTSLAAKASQPSARFGRGLAELELNQQKAGAEDIVEARRSDPEIDAMFVLLGVLPQKCGQLDAAACPPGFPARLTQPAGRPMVTTLLRRGPDAEEVYALGIDRLAVMVAQMQRERAPFSENSQK